MKKSIIIFSLLLSSIQAYNFALKQEYNQEYSAIQHPQPHHHATAQEIVEKYNQFQRDFGLDTRPLSQDDINELFNSDLKKIINKKVEVVCRKDLLDQLNRAKKWCGGWTDITVQYIIPSADGKHCFLRYTFTSTLQGSYDIMVLFTITDGKISCIDEIANRIE